MKRADLSTLDVLRAIEEHGQIAGHEHLCSLYPAKVVAAAFEREVARGNLDYGVTLRSAWIEPAGKRLLAQARSDAGNG